MTIEEKWADHGMWLDLYADGPDAKRGDVLDAAREVLLAVLDEAIPGAPSTAHCMACDTRRLRLRTRIEGLGE